MGALAGLLLGLLLMPLAARLPVAGGGWYLADLVPHPAVLTALLAAVPLLVTASATAGLRQVVIGPLSVARRHTPRALRAWRAVVFVAVLLGFAQFAGGAGFTTALAARMALVFAALSLVGPWAVGLLGRLVTATARGPAQLLAGRRLLDDPRSAWRTIGGVVLAGFVAGLLVPLAPETLLTPARADALELVVPAADADRVAADARARLAAAGLAVDVTLADPAFPFGHEDGA